MDVYIGALMTVVSWLAALWMGCVAGLSRERARRVRAKRVILLLYVLLSGSTIILAAVTGWHAGLHWGWKVAVHGLPFGMLGGLILLWRRAGNLEGHGLDEASAGRHGQ